MVLQEFLDIAKHSELNTLPIKENNDAIISFINLGLLELYTRFVVKTEEHIVELQDGKTIYSMPKDYLKMSSAWEPVKEADTTVMKPLPVNEETNVYSVNTISYNEIQVPVSTTGGLISIIYIPKPVKMDIGELGKELPIPDQLITPLLNFVAYKAHSGIDSGVQTEDSVHYVRFERSCDKVESLGYGVASDDLSMESKFLSRGFV
jgi:hypothetical protein